MPKKATIDEIIGIAKGYLPKLDEKRVRRAYEFAAEAHEGQKRDSGEPYIQHPLEVTKILLELKPDEDSIVVALLHDVLEDTPKTAQEIEKEFGKSVIPLLKGLEKLSTVAYRGKERQVENLRKMFMAMAQDIRVILIKLCDRLHNMRTLHYAPERKHLRTAEETITVYSPIAARLGIYEIKDELDDLGFKYSHPKDYKRITAELKKEMGVRENVIKKSTRLLAKTLKEAGIKATIEGRIKNPYSIYKKLQRKGKNYLNELYDILALRIVVADEASCYQTLGAVHKHWTPLQRRFKDYIAVPKPNGYQSLHTTLIGLCPDIHNQPTEVQIRSEDMDRVAKFGIAAHWTYKEAGGKSVIAPKEKLTWVKNLVELHQSLESNEEFINTLNVDVFHDRIFVLTPKGDVKDLPADATPVDFAYAIHTEVGHKVKAAKVNGSIVPLNYKLKNGEVIEIITGNQNLPNRYWLSFVKTSHAKSSIKNWFNNQDRDKLIRLGKEMVNDLLDRFGQPHLDPEISVFKIYEGRKLSLRERESMLEKIANGSVNASTVVRKALPALNIPETEEKKPSPQVAIPEGAIKTADILITGEKGLKTQIATCCSPKVGDMIIGYITRGKGVTIHKQGCKVLKGNDEKRLIPASWGIEKPQFKVQLVISRTTRIGFLRDVAAVLADNNLPIFDIQNISADETKKGDLIVRTSVEMDQIDLLQKVIDELKAIPNVLDVKEKPIK